MAPNFPFNVKFDKEAFRSEVTASQSAKVSDDSELHYYLKSHGVRYIVEAPGEDLEGVRRTVGEILGLDVRVEPLFVRANDMQQIPEEMQAYFLVSIANVTFSDLHENPYDAAYALLGGSSFRSVEPDLPYGQFLSGSSTAMMAGSGSPPTDLAWSLRNIHADTAWTIMPPAGGQRDGCGISIGHLDTGWTDHVDLDRGNFDTSRIEDFITKNGDARDSMNYWGNPGHGTRTGSVIMSQGTVSSIIPPGTGGPGAITGLARRATYIPIRCIKSVGVIFNSNIARAVDHATANNCDVISMSLGGLPLRGLHTAIRTAWKQNVLIVCAAGNNVRITVWPANYKESIAVAASNVIDRPWSGTSRGTAVDICAPGQDVWKAEPNKPGNAYSPGSGTSYATAVVAGVAALWLGFYDKSNLVRVGNARGKVLQELFREELKSSARRPAGWNTANFGAGIVDVYRLLNLPSMHIIMKTLLSITVSGRQRDHVPAEIAELKKHISRLVDKASWNALDAFDHELSYLALAKANGEIAGDMSSEQDTLLNAIEKAGSQTLRNLIWSKRE